jgi:hypothetical protein
VFIGAEWQRAVPWVDFQVPEKKGGLNREGGDWTGGGGRQREIAFCRESGGIQRI